MPTTPQMLLRTTTDGPPPTLSNVGTVLRYLSSITSRRWWALTLEVLPFAALFLWLRPLKLIASVYSIPGDYLDTWQTVWNLWWLQQVRPLGLSSIYATDAIFHPWGCRLDLHTLDESLAYPLAFLFPHAAPQQLLTVAMVILFSANYLSMRCLLRTMGVRPWLALLLSACFCVQPHFLFHLRGGHLNLMTFFPIPIMLCYLLRLIQLKKCREIDDAGESQADPARSTAVAWRPRLWQQRSLIAWGVGAAAALTFLGYSDFYYPYFLAILLIVLLPALHFSRLLPITLALKAILPIGLCALLLMTPKLYGFVKTARDGNFEVKRKPSRLPSDILNMFTPYTEQAWSKVVQSRLYGDDRYRRGEFLGFAIPLLALCGALFYRNRIDRRMWRILRCFLLAALCFFILTAGESVLFKGQVLFIDPLYTLLAKTPFFPGMPSRFGIMCQLLLYLSAAVFVEHALKNRASRRWVVAALCLLVCESMPLVPFVSSSRPPTPALAELGNDTSIAAVLDIDVKDKTGPMSRQMYHGKHILLAYIARTPKRQMQLALKNNFVRFLRHAPSDASSPALRSAWDALKVEAVIVNRADAHQLTRVSKVPWLHERYSDSRLAIFTPKSATDT